jgi:hypothetical protein
MAPWSFLRSREPLVPWPSSRSSFAAMYFQMWAPFLRSDQVKSLPMLQWPLPSVATLLKNCLFSSRGQRHRHPVLTYACQWCQSSHCLLLLNLPLILLFCQTWPSAPNNLTSFCSSSGLAIPSEKPLSFSHWTLTCGHQQHKIRRHLCRWVNGDALVLSPFILALGSSPACETRPSHQKPGLLMPTCSCHGWWLDVPRLPSSWVSGKLLLVGIVLFRNKELESWQFIYDLLLNSLWIMAVLRVSYFLFLKLESPIPVFFSMCMKAHLLLAPGLTKTCKCLHVSSLKSKSPCQLLGISKHLSKADIDSLCAKNVFYVLTWLKNEHSWHKYYVEFKLYCPYVFFIWNPATSILLLIVILFTLQRHSWVVGTELPWFINPK